MTYQFPPYGGKAVQRASKLAKYLPDFGWQPIVFTMPISESGIPIDQSLFDELPSCVEIVRPKFRNWWKLIPHDIRKYVYKPLPDIHITWARSVEKELIALINKTGAQAIITTSPSNSTQLLGLAVKQNTGVPWIADFRDSWFYHPSDLLKKGADYLKKMETQVIENADAVVGVTPKILHGFEGRIPSEKMHLIENGYDEADFYLVDWEKKQADNILRMGYNGSVSFYRDPAYLLEPVSSLIESGELDPKTVRIIFTSSEEGKKWFAPFRELEKSGVLVINNYLPHAESLAGISEVDVLILLLTKVQDVYPAKIFEYMYLGNHILSLSTPGDDLDKLLTGTKSGSVADYSNPEEVKKAILELIEKKRSGELKRLSQTRNEIIGFSRKQIAQRIAKILDSIT